MGWIDDPITELAHFTNRRLLEVGRVVGDGIGGLIYSIKVLVLTPKESRKAYRRRLTESEENARIAGCKKVTLDFATMLGYISREVMSKEELESLIFESGITPQEDPVSKLFFRKKWAGGFPQFGGFRVARVSRR